MSTYLASLGGGIMIGASAIMLLLMRPHSGLCRVSR